MIKVNITGERNYAFDGIKTKSSYELARKLKIKKQDWNWTLFRKWSNWALVNLENIIDWIVAQYKRYNPSENITTSTYLL